MRKFSFEKIYPKAVIAVTLLAVGIVFFRNMFPPLENAIILDTVSSAVTGASGLSAADSTVSSAADDSAVSSAAVSESGVILQTSDSVSGSGTRSLNDPSSTSEDTEPVNINSADISQLITLDGIGEARAKAIIEYREKNGGFKSVDELTKVSGIGEKTLEKNRSRIAV